jgi:hypothetical protein
VQTVLKKISVTLSLLASFSVYAGSTSDPDVYLFEGGASLIDLYSMSGTTNMNASDDSVSGWSPTFPWTFTIWDENYTRAKMSTNGCVNFTGLNCSDYTPQPLPYRDNTLYPFWTDLIRGTSSGGQTSKMLYKGFDDYVVFGWYYMREYQRSSSNSFEVLLHKNNTYEYRYRELDIIQHDVLIGEQNSSSDHKTYRFYDDNTGGHNTWDSYDASFGSSKLEGGGSLSSASFEDMCANNVLYNSSCTGYAAAYLAQQCGISALHDTSCTGYAAAYLAQQCGLSALYNTSCSGYAEAYFSQQCGLSALYNTGCSGYAAAYFTQQCGINALYDTDCSGYALAYYTLQCSRDALYDSGCDGYWEEIAYQASLVAVTTVDTSGIDDTDMYGYDDDTAAQSLGYASEDEYYGYDYDDYDYDDGTDTDYYYDDDPYLYDDSTDQEFYAVDVTEFDQGQVDISYGTEVVVIDTGSTFVEENDYYYEDDETYETDTNVEVYDTTEEVYWAVLDTNLDTYDTEVEIDFPEETFLWDTEETPFEEDIQIEYEDLEELEEIFLEELDYEEMELAQVLLDDIDVYILQEETGLELIREEDWTPEEELDLYEDVLEDFERDALEELEEEIYEEFADEIDEDALEELIDEELEEEFIDEEDLEDEVEEEFFEEAEEKEIEVEEKKQSRAQRLIARTKRGTTTNQYQTRNTSTNSSLVSSSSSSNISSSTNSSNIIAAASSSGASTSQVMQQQETGQQQSSGQQTQQQVVEQQQSQGDFSSAPASDGQQTQQQQVAQQITQEIQINEQLSNNNSTNTVSNNSNGSNNINTSSGVSTNETQDFSSSFATTTVGTNNFDSIGEVSPVFVEPMAEVEFEEISIDTGFAEVSVEFEQTFNDALGAGQSIGQFLSNTAPNFSRFNVEPPTIEQSNTIAAVESLADRVGTEQAQANLEAQFESMEETGGFGDQTVAVAFIGYAPGFSAYTDQAQLTDREFYRDMGLPSPDVVDNNFSFYMMAGNADRKIAAMRR